jgi:hypothetical protein
MRHINLIIVHCSATGPDTDIGAGEIDSWHKDRGWSGIGYHNVIRLNGTLEHGRSLSQPGAHAYGYNKNSIGVCLIGGISHAGKPENTFTNLQFDTLRGYIDTMLSLFPEAEVVGHRDLSPDVDGDGIIEKHEWLKQCPCFDVKKWYYGGKK